MGGADTVLAAHPVRPAATIAAKPAAAAPARMASVALRASIDPYLQFRARMSSTLEARPWGADPALWRAAGTTWSGSSAPGWQAPRRQPGCGDPRAQQSYGRGL